MTKSMTAYACDSLENDQCVISCEIKTLNHRYLELNMRLPDELRPFEMALRERLTQKLSRGKVDVSCRYQLKTEAEAAIKINSMKVDNVIAACNEIEMQMGVGQAISAFDVLAYPGVVDDAQQASFVDESLLLQCLEKALTHVNTNRDQEGERLKEMILDRAKKIRNIVQTIRKRQPDIVTEIRKKLQKKLEELTENVDDDRLQQELVYLAQKMDIDEELDRLISHLVSLQNAFTENGPIGRRLDFLMQEFNREANTIASKSADAETTKAAVDLKVLIEQMREQIQNIE